MPISKRERKICERIKTQNDGVGMSRSHSLITDHKTFINRLKREVIANSNPQKVRGLKLNLWGVFAPGLWAQRWWLKWKTAWKWLNPLRSISRALSSLFSAGWHSLVNLRISDLRPAGKTQMVPSRVLWSEYSRIRGCISRILHTYYSTATMQCNVNDVE